MTLCQPAQALVGGAPSADILAVSSDQKRAIGRVWPVKGLPGFFCTGVLVAPRWVLTAKHCNQGIALTFEQPETADSAGARYTGVQVVSHPDLDALLIELGDPVPGAVMNLLGEPIDDSWIDTPVQLAGYGVGENGTVATELEFLVERVTSVNADTVVVDGEGRSGACAGDSGGPILTRDGRGELVVAGLLSGGSASCRNVDRYVRADLLYSWVLEQTGVVANPERACGALGSGGFCRRGTAMWCDDTIQAEPCDAGRVCGWDAHAAGYRCVPAMLDGCKGVDDLGACADHVARRCAEGHVIERNCGDCDLACDWDASKGRFDCLADL